MKRYLRYFVMFIFSASMMPALAVCDGCDEVAGEVITLEENMAERRDKMVPYFNRGALGMMSNGLIGIRNIYRLSEDGQLDARKIAALENRDRTRLYELLGSEGVREQAVERWILRAKPGWWYRDTEGKWLKK